MAEGGYTSTEVKTEDHEGNKDYVELVNGLDDSQQLIQERKAAWERHQEMLKEWKSAMEERKETLMERRAILGIEYHEKVSKN